MTFGAIAVTSCLQKRGGSIRALTILYIRIKLSGDFTVGWNFPGPWRMGLLVVRQDAGP